MRAGAPPAERTKPERATSEASFSQYQHSHLQRTRLEPASSRVHNTPGHFPGVIYRRGKSGSQKARSVRELRDAAMRLGGVSREPAGPGERAGRDGLICIIVDLAERPSLPFHIKHLAGGGYLDIASRGTPPTTCCANFWHSASGEPPRPSPQERAPNFVLEASRSRGLQHPGPLRSRKRPSRCRVRFQSTTGRGDTQWPAKLRRRLGTVV